MQNDSENLLDPEKIDRGTILHIEKMALFDGEGMRTVVFLKGCPLRCQWCSTPESQNPALQLGYNPDKCTGCQKCVAICPRNAILTNDGRRTVKTDPKMCSLCFKCVDVCPVKARKQYGRQVNPRQIIQEVEKDEIFYFHSGGGVTLSGGEPLVQSEFTKAILSGCKERGLHTAIETSGYVPWAKFLEVLPLLDAVLIDIKVFDPRRHEELTGHSNERIIRNIRKMDKSKFPLDLFVRIPLIPGINDSDENLSATAEFCKGLKKFKELHILPYHRLGMESYAFLNKLYHLKNLQAPSMELVKERAAKLMQKGIAVKIDG